MKTFVMGDPHGGLLAIQQTLQRANFNFTEDKLIVLGDVSDGWSQTSQSFDFLIDNVKNLVYVKGNHDQWLLEWLEFGRQEMIWTEQGGRATLASYLSREDFHEVSKKHLAFLKSAKCFYLDDKKRLFVHGGIDLSKKLEDQTERYMMWDRDLWEFRHRSDNIRKGIMRYKEIFVGHTSIWRFSHMPIKYGNVWFMDTGGGYEGSLSLMDIDSGEVFQSDPVKELYPNDRGRN
jgi:serine/threonine protein phosphatase 1